MKRQMYRRVLIFLMLLGFADAAISQQEVTIRFLDQYESPVRSVMLQTVRGRTSYQADKEGRVTVSLLPDENVQVFASGYDSTAFVYNRLPESKQVLLKKSFGWKDLLNPMFYITYGGLWLLLLIVFAETGLFAGFFLPGDSLLFVAGIYSGNLAHEFLKLFGLGGLQSEWVDLLVLVGLISLAGIIGNTVGFWFGRKIGPSMFRWKDNFFFKKKYLDEAHEFYEKHGGGAVVFARFLPIVRTFAPIIAGIVGMEKKKFAFYNIVGCVAWVFTMIFAGHFLQKWVKTQFGFELKDHLEVIVIGIILVTTAPVLLKLFKGKAKPRPDSKEEEK